MSMRWARADPIEHERIAENPCDHDERLEDILTQRTLQLTLHRFALCARLRGFLAVRGAGGAGS